MATGESYSPYTPHNPHNPHNPYGSHYDNWMFNDFQVRMDVTTASGKIEKMRQEARNLEAQIPAWESQSRNLNSQIADLQAKIKQSQDPNEIRQLQQQVDTLRPQADVLRAKVADARNKIPHLRSDAERRMQDLRFTEMQYHQANQSSEREKHEMDRALRTANEYLDRAKDEQRIAGGLRREENDLRNRAINDRQKETNLLNEAARFEIEGPRQVKEGQANLSASQTAKINAQNYLQKTQIDLQNLPSGRPEDIAKAQDALSQARSNQSAAINDAQQKLTKAKNDYTDGTNRAQAEIDRAIKEKADGILPYQTKINELKNTKQTAITQREALEAEHDVAFMEKEITAIEKAGGWFSNKDGKVRELLTKTRSYGETESIYPNANVDQKARMFTLLLGGLLVSGDNKGAAQKIIKEAKIKNEMEQILDKLANNSKIRDRVKDLV